MSSSLAVVVLLTLTQRGPDPVHKIIKDFPHGVDSLSFSPDGKTLATGTWPTEEGKEALRLWDVATGKEICVLGDNHTFGCRPVVFSPDGKTLVTNGGPGDTLQLWDVVTRKVRLSIKVLRGVGGRLAVSPDSKLFAASSPGVSGRVYDMQTGKELLLLEGDFPAISMTFSPDGKLIAGSTNEGLVVLWDAATGKQRASWKKHSRAVNSVFFSPDSKTLYSVGKDHFLIYWDTASGKERKAIELKKKRRARPYVQVEYAALSPDGHMLAVMGGNIVRLFDLRAEQFVPGAEWGYQDGDQRCLAFSPDGKLLATGSGGRPITR